MENKRKNSAENKKHLNIQEIKEIIPHRHPFLLIDYVEDYEPGQYAVAYKCVSYREEFFAGHFPAGTGDAWGTDGGSFGTDWGSGDLIGAGKSRERLHILAGFPNVNSGGRSFREIKSV